jgi:O-succinylbenzoic acid--CoA ligase
MSSAHHIKISSVELHQPALLTSEMKLNYASFLDSLPDLSSLGGQTVVVECDNSLSNARFLLSAWIHHLTCYLIPANSDVSILKQVHEISGASTIIAANLKSGIKTLLFDDFPQSELSHAFEFEDDHVPFVIQTSGSTGTPKWVPVNNRQLFTAFQSSAAFVRPASGEFWLSVLPLHHIGGLSIWLRSFHRKSAVALHQPFDAKNVLALMRSHTAIRFASFVPTMLRRLIQLMDEPFSTKRTVLLGGGPVSAQLIRSAIDKNMDVITSFGMSETAAQITGYQYSASNLPEDDILWSGPVQAPNEFRLSGDGPPNEGFLWLKGPQIFTGYLHFDGEQPFEHGWFNTGDIAHFSSQNGLRILMRRTDRIVTGGENVDPINVQDELRKISDVQDVVVLGVEDEEWGQKVVAFLEIKDDTEIQITRTFIKENTPLLAHEIPQEIIQLERFPTLTNGKIDRQKLRTLI